MYLPQCLDDKLLTSLVVEEDKLNDYPYVKAILTDTKDIIIDSQKSLTVSALQNHRVELMRVVKEYCSSAKTEACYLQDCIRRHEKACDIAIDFISEEKKRRSASLLKIQAMDSLEEELDWLTQAISGLRVSLLQEPLQELMHLVIEEAKIANDDSREALTDLIKQTHLTFFYPRKELHQNYNRLIAVWQDKNPHLAQVMRRLMGADLPCQIEYESSDSRVASVSPASVSPPTPVPYSLPVSKLLSFADAMKELKAKAEHHSNDQVKQRLNELLALFSNEYELKRNNEKCIRDLTKIVNHTLQLMDDKPSEVSFVRYCRRATQWSNQYKSSSAKFIAKAMLALAVAIIIGAGVFVPMFSAMVVAAVAAIGASSSLAVSGFFRFSDTRIAKTMRSFERARKQECDDVDCSPRPS